MKRIYNFILLVCLVQLAVAQNRIAEIRENLLGNYSDRVLVVSHRANDGKHEKCEYQGGDKHIVGNTGINPYGRKS